MAAGASLPSQAAAPSSAPPATGAAGSTDPAPGAVPDQDAPGEETEGDESSRAAFRTQGPRQSPEETAPDKTVPESPPPRAPEAEEGGVVRQHRTRRVRVRPERTVREPAGEQSASAAAALSERGDGSGTGLVDLADSTPEVSMGRAGATIFTASGFRDGFQGFGTTKAQKPKTSTLNLKLINV